MNTSAVIETQNKHVSIRSFKPDPISDEMLNNILEGARRSPTSSNMQAYSIVVVRDPEKKAKLAELAGGQQHIVDCPVFLAFCADLNRLDVTAQLHGVEMNNNLETFLVASIDAALVGMSAQTGAESLGLGAVMVGAMRNHPEKVAELLELPGGVYVAYGMSMGWPAEIPPQKPRLPQDLVIHQESYSKTDARESIQSYDVQLADHYEALGVNQDQAAWSGPISRALGRRGRSELKSILSRLGFNI